MSHATLEIPPRVISSPIKPVSIRLPENGTTDPYFGLRRSALNALILPTEANGFKPPVKSFVLRKKGARTGIRLIDFDSLESYVRAHEEAA